MDRIIGEAHDGLGTHGQRRISIGGQPGEHVKSSRERALRKRPYRFRRHRGLAMSNEFTQAVEGQGRVVGPKHPKPSLQHRAWCMRIVE